MHKSYTSRMGIWNRLGNIIQSYLREGAGDLPWRNAGNYHAPDEARDPDLDAAFEELEGFLRGEDGKPKDKNKEPAREPPLKPVSDEIRRDFAELNLTPEASAAECKAAYKKLLKLHHPDRHASNPGDMKKATEKTTRVNAAYGRLEKWFES